MPIALEPQKLMSTLRFLWLEITEKCNLDCSHCYVDASPKKPLLGRMTNANWKKLLHDAYLLGYEIYNSLEGNLLCTLNYLFLFAILKS